MIQIPRQAYGSGLRLVDWRIYVASIFGGVARRRNTPITASVSSGAAFVFTASISGGAGNGINGMLRKEFYVVRKKYHVVRKLFYVASIFGGAAGRRNRPPWELSSTASRRRQRLQCVYRAPVFSRGAHTSLPDTNNAKYWRSLFTINILKRWKT